MKQSRRSSFIESCTNTFSATLLSLGISWAIMANLNQLPPFQMALILTSTMTVVSIARNYTIRRLFV